CGRGPNRRRHRRRDVGFAGHDFPAQLHRATDLPSHRPDAETFAKPVRIVGGTGHPRHQFGGRSLGEIRRGGAGRRNDREIGACAVDCAPVRRHGCGQRQQDAHPMAVVHPVLLPGGGGEHLPVSRRNRVPVPVQRRQADVDHHTVPDRGKPLAGRLAQGWSASAAARRAVVDCGRGGEPAGHSRRVDRNLRLNFREFRERFVAIVLLAVCWISLPTAAAGQDASPRLKREPPQLCAACVRSNLDYLAGSALHGRGSGTEDEHLAARFIARKLRQYGLAPAAEDGHYIQTATVRSGDVTTAFSKVDDAPGAISHTWNVLAKIEGSDEKDEIILLSAHLDHLGVKNGKTYPGADDDASGAVAVMELARELAKEPRPRRTIVFALWGSEEKGLIGARYFLKHPTFNLRNVVANLEFEMI